MKLVLISALAIAGVAVLAGCGETPSDSPDLSRSRSPAGSQDTCSLLTDEDIRSVMGVAPGPAKFEGVQCIWPSADGSNEFLVQLIATPTLVRSYDQLAKQYREELDTDPVTAIHPIDGVGQFAVGFNETPMVQIFTESRMVQVATFGHQEKHALELAKRAAARLN